MSTSPALKDLYNKAMIDELCSAIMREDKPFNATSFKNVIFNTDWEEKELKQRMRHIAETLHVFLPENYSEAIGILKKISPQFDGFEYMFFPDYVELYGLEHFDISIKALEHFTPNSSSELAVRPFIKKFPKKMMEQMERWASSDNHHVRRLASEGCRPRLPWAMQLPVFREDPTPVIKILEKLKNDESEFVRRSVANNLNDISKDHPDITVQLAKKWLGKSKETDWVIKHGCRTLLKQGRQEALSLFGFSNVDHIQIGGLYIQEAVRMGETLSFSFDLKSAKGSLGKLRIEYAIDFVKANGKQSRKVFKIAESNYVDQLKQVTRAHSFKPITTRKYYPGTHGLAIIINGQEQVHGTFELLYLTNKIK